MIASLLFWQNPYIAEIEKLTGEPIVQCRTPEEARAVLPEAEVLITMGGGLDEHNLALCTKLKLVLSLSAGVEKLPLAALQERGIMVCNTRGAHGASIAEYVLGGMLIFSHRYHSYLHNQARTQWQHVFDSEDLEGKTICIVGAGSIGREIGKKAKAFDMKVLGIKLHPEPLEHFDEVWESGRLREALGLADYVVLITPMTQQTRHLFGEAEFQAMKRSAVFINVSRGGTVDEEALLLALREEQIFGAVLDVFEREPLPSDHPFWKMENVIVTPHNAGLTGNSARKTVRIVSDNILRYRQGTELVNVIPAEQTY